MIAYPKLLSPRSIVLSADPLPNEDFVLDPALRVFFRVPHPRALYLGCKKLSHMKMKPNTGRTPPPPPFLLCRNDGVVCGFISPGTVFLQGLPFDRMVDQIARRIPGGRGSGGFIPVGIGGSTGGTDEGGEGGGAEAGEGAGEATAAVGDGGGMAAAAAGEESIAAASGGQG